MAEYAKTSEITPLIGKPGDYAVLESGISEKPCKDAEKQNKSLWSDTSIRQKCMLLFVIVGHFTVYLCVSIPGPFMARVVIERGGNLLQSTLLMQITIFVMAISSIVFAKYQTFIGSKELLLSGLACFGICQTVFGLLNFSDNATVLVYVGMTIRTFEGIGLGAYVVAALTMVCQTFSDCVGQVFGIVESAAGIGYLAGPMMGSLLYSISDGMLLPFLSSGVMLLIMTVIGALILKHDSDRTKALDKFNVFEFILNARSFLTLGAAATVYGAYGIFGASATIYLKSRGFSVVEVGLAMLADSLAYCLTTVVIGYVSNIGRKSRRTVLILGLICMTGSVLLFSSKQIKLWIYVGASFLGIFGGFALIACFSELIDIAVGDNRELETNFALHSAISGAWNFVFGVGVFVYPLLGSALEKIMTFNMSMLACSIIGYCFTILVAILLLIRMQCRQEKGSKDAEMT